jgi:hypothetical protein
MSKPIDAGIGAQLAERSPLGRGYRRAWPGHQVGLADAEQQRAVQPGGAAARAKRRAEQPAGGGAIAPARVLADRNHVAPARLATGRVDESRLVRLSDRRQVPAADRGAQHAGGEQWRGAVRLAHQVEERHLSDRRCHPGVFRRRRERVAGSHRGPEGRHPIAVHARQRAGAGDRRPPVLALSRRAEHIRLATAVAEAAVVEDQRRDSRRREAFGERPQPVPPGAGEAMAHDDRRRSGRAAGRRV